MSAQIVQNIFNLLKINKQQNFFDQNFIMGKNQFSTIAIPFVKRFEALIASPSLEVCAFKNQFIDRIITLKIHTQWRGGTVGAVWSAAFSRPASTQKRHAVFYTCFALALCGALTVKRRAPVLFAAATSRFLAQTASPRERIAA